MRAQPAHLDDGAVELGPQRGDRQIGHGDDLGRGKNLDPGVFGDALLDHALTDDGLVPDEDETVIFCEQCDAVQTTHEDLVWRVIATHHIDCDSHGLLRLLEFELEPGAHVAAFHAGCVRELGAAAVGAADGRDGAEAIV